MEIERESDATWVIPTEDEWYKAAYHYNDGVTGNYYDYPTSSGSVPAYVDDGGNLSGTGTPFAKGGPDPGNYATYDGDGGTDGIGAAYYRTQVGEWENSASPYGTFDQSGDVYEWNEAVMGPGSRGVRGGSFDTSGWVMRAPNRFSFNASLATHYYGFRVAVIAECGDGTCVAGVENQCNCPEDCGDPPTTEGQCNDGIDNDCDELVDCADPDCKGVRPCSVPAASAWGVALAALVVLTVATLALRGRRLARASGFCGRRR